MSGASCEHQSWVDRHFEGTIGTEDERSMRVHLESCDECRARYRRRQVLAKLDPDALSAEARIGRALGLEKAPAPAIALAPDPAPTKRRVLFPVFPVFPAALAVVAAAAMVAFFVRGPKATEGGFASRGVGLVLDAPDAVDASEQVSPSLRVYRIANGRPAAAVDTLRRDDELAFAYENRLKKSHLMVFGVDDTSRVYWFYPAWTRPEDDPAAVPISVEGGVHELPDAVAHRFQGTALEVHALFLDGPTTVRVVEDAVSRKKLGELTNAHVVQRLRIEP